jgi:hypothetical protein
MEKTVIIISLLFFVLLSIGAKKSPKPKFWIGSKVECCGVKNPVKNLQWINFKEDAPNSDFSCVLLFQNNLTKEYYIVIQAVCAMRTGMHLIVMDKISIYNCNGEKLDSGAFFRGKPTDVAMNFVVSQGKKLNKRINKINKRLAALEKKLDEERKYITESAPNLQRPNPCESWADFLSTHTLVDVVSYSYIK